MLCVCMCACTVVSVCTSTYMLDVLTKNYSCSLVSIWQMNVCVNCIYTQFMEIGIQPVQLDDFLTTLFIHVSLL